MTDVYALNEMAVKSQQGSAHSTYSGLKCLSQRAYALSQKDGVSLRSVKIRDAADMS